MPNSDFYSHFSPYALLVKLFLITFNTFELIDPASAQQDLRLYVSSETTDVLAAVVVLMIDLYNANLINIGHQRLLTDM